MRRATKQICDMLEPVTRSMGYEFVGAELGQAENGMTLRVYIDVDKAEGIKVEDCADVSRQLSALLDVEDPIAGEYCLEVSSPGIERPLFNEEQFTAEVGKMVKIKLLHPLVMESGERRNFKGTLKTVAAGLAEVEVDGVIFELDLNDVEQASLVHQF